MYTASQGAFDLTVMPLVNAWGFGPAKPIRPDSARIDSLRKIVGFEKIRYTRDSVVKADPRVQLDFGGIGQGYGVGMKRRNEIGSRCEVLGVEPLNRA